MKLFAIHYHGSYCMLVQIVRASSIERAQVMADTFMASDFYSSFTVKALDVDGDEGTIFEAGYIE